MIAKNYSNHLIIINKMSNHDDDTTSSYSCYWLCNRKAKLKVYTDFGNVLYLCRQCYEIYDPFHRLKTEEVRSGAKKE
jgi:hypothetical protein